MKVVETHEVLTNARATRPGLRGVVVTSASAVTIPIADNLVDALAVLPFGARTNGLAGHCWAPLLVVDHLSVDQLLLAFRDAAVPACSAPNRPTRGRVTPDRVWVDAARYATAEDVVRRVLAVGRVCEGDEEA